MVQEDEVVACVDSIEDLSKWEQGMIRGFPPSIVEDLKKIGKIRRVCNENEKTEE